jgi:hypothetical protein
MTKSAFKPSRKVILLAALGILIPLFIVSMAFLAVRSDKKTQLEYQRIKEQQQLRIQEKLATQESDEHTPAASTASK